VRVRNRLGAVRGEAWEEAVVSKWDRRGLELRRNQGLDTEWGGGF
jgi:hypothetical protein